MDETRLKWRCNYQVWEVHHPYELLLEVLPTSPVSLGCLRMAIVGHFVHYNTLSTA
jgi:hypothetical protein